MTVETAASNGEIFMQNDFIAIGINKFGTLGTSTYAPTQFDTDVEHGYYRLGIFADVDGFDSGVKSTLRDVMLPGTPIESFTLSYKMAGKQYDATNSGLNMSFDVKGAGKNSSSADEGRAAWSGSTTEKLSVDQTITLTEDGKYFQFDVVLKNTSSTTMSDLHYLRSIDPDLGATFGTYNKIVDQGAGKALVTAAANSSGSPFFIYADDARAAVSIYGFEVESGYEAATLKGQAEGYATSADVSLNLNFTLGDLLAGQSTKVTFYMGVTNNLTSTIASIDAGSDDTPDPVPVNDAPVTVADTLSIDFGKSGTGNVLANDKDADGDALSASLVSGPKNGTLTLNKDGSYSYVAKAGFSGTDSFTYAASDGTLSTKGTVAITVKADPNLAPTTVTDTLSVDFGKSGTGNVLANDKDADGDALSASLVSGPKNGTLTLNKDGSFSYVAKSGFSGTDSFTYAASDGKLSTNETVAIVVKPAINLAPETLADTLTVEAGKTGTGNVLNNDKDADGDSLSASLVSGPKNGTLTLNKDGSYSYAAKEGFSGTDSFTYATSDGKLSTNGVATITVKAPVNDAPIAANDSLTVGSGKTGTGNVLTNDKDANGDTLSAALVSGPKNGTLTLNKDGSYSYVAKAGFSGTDSFTYAASDGKLSANGIVSIKVDAPAPTGPDLPVSDLLKKAGTVNLSDALSQTFTGADHHNAFYVDAVVKTGYDTLSNFQRSDVLVLNKQIYDSNSDGYISFKNNKLDVDGSAGSDVLVLKGVSTLRYMGTEDGLHIYANNATRPNGATESRMADDVLKGDVGDKTRQKFFFDTGLDLNLGNDTISNFGKNDIIVTTSALQLAGGSDVVNIGAAGELGLFGASGAIDDVRVAGEGGHVIITDTSGQAVTGIEFDGSVSSGGVTYFVYSAIGSAVGIEALGF